MRLIARPIDQWPGPLRDDVYRDPPRFTAYWSDTVDLLAREVDMLTTPSTEPEVVLQLAVRERDLRLDGWIRADARPTHPGVIVSFDSVHGPLRYTTDQFRSGSHWRTGQGSITVPGWQANVRAVALGLEALRKVDRYGISKDGEQYRGWNALPPAREAGAAQMTVDEATRFLAHHGGPWIDKASPPEQHVDALATRLLDPDSAGAIAGLYRIASKRLHPDAGGDPALFRRLTEARDLLEAHR